ncbi:MAG: OB-fold nucleic acid binding domain-containing protein [Candidatus Methanofastidiosia archaeon]
MAARKMRIKDVVFGQIEEGKRRTNFIINNFGKNDEVRICGTVISRFCNEERSYGSIVVDDSSETIPVKFWREDVAKIDNFKEGDIVDLIGRVGVYNDDIYIQPILMVHTEMNFWIKFHLEVAMGIKKLMEKGEWEEVKMLLEESVEESEKLSEPVVGEVEEESIIFDDEDITKAVLQTITPEGVTRDDILEKTGLDEIDVMLSIKELLEDGEIFEADDTYKRI